VCVNKAASEMLKSLKMNEQMQLDSEILWKAFKIQINVFFLDEIPDLHMPYPQERCYSTCNNMPQHELLSHIFNKKYEKLKGYTTVFILTS
jgi:hypothetical protein